MGRPRSRFHCGDNAVWDNRGRRELRTSVNVPTKQDYPRASLWICAAEDITAEFLKSSFATPPLIITCKDEVSPDVEAACHVTGAPLPILFNIRQFQNRTDMFFGVILPSVKESLDSGLDVFL